MKISSLMVKNFRGLSIEIENISRIVTIFGKNDTRKTNLCKALIKLLIMDSRRLPMTIEDSTNNNEEDIEIQVTFELSNLSKRQRSEIGKYTYRDKDKEFIDYKLVGVFNSETQLYEEDVYYGEIRNKPKKVSTNRQNSIDKCIQVLYVRPDYNLEIDKKTYFKHKKAKDIQNNEVIDHNIETKINELTKAIQENSSMIGMVKEVNDFSGFKVIFEGLRFNVIPNIKRDNLLNSIDIVPTEEDIIFNNIGDGKNKILSMLLQTKLADDNKSKIFIIEEPENHLYPILQTEYLSSLKSLNPDQLFVTTHSPYIVDYSKLDQIIKLYLDSDRNTKFRSFNVEGDGFKNFGYLLNQEVAEMLYYNTVLLVEGSSEKYFYNYLSLKDVNFKKKLYEGNIGIYSVDGIKFRDIKKLLESLDITVFIKTDNDIFDVKNSNNKRYSGLTRAISYVSDDLKEELREILGFEDLCLDRFTFHESKGGIDVIEDKKEKISEILLKENILFSTHNDGFERDLFEYLKDMKEEDIRYLRRAKLKNLHSYLDDNKINVSMSYNDFNSILLEFIK
jgi:putative ATP-dependent endonuclease of OLD family